MHSEDQLARYAAKSSTSRGRRFQEEFSSGRTQYQRDRDRIIHSTGFRRMEYKTQVFVNHEGDLFRTRLTHSIEVAQIARSIACSMGLNEDLAEAIALAHDLGHTPFGHAGQDALDACMKPYGGFEHNLQSLRQVDTLEERYGAFDGLNLTYETREGILKHCAKNNAVKLGDLGARFLNQQQPTLEAQLVNLADSIAYNNHDIDDGLRSGLISVEQLGEVALYARHASEVDRVMPGISARRASNEAVRRIINALVTDLVATSQRHILEANPQSVDAVREAGKLILFSASMHTEATQLQQFLNKNLYHHHIVSRMRVKARRIITDLFTIFMEEPSLLAPDYYLGDAAPEVQARKIADYIAGMTDRYAIKEHGRLFAVGNVW